MGGKRSAVAVQGRAGATLVMLLATSSCASMFPNGGHFATGSEKMTSRQSTADGSPMQGTTNAEYWLIRLGKGVALAQIDRTGDGTPAPAPGEEPAHPLFTEPAPTPPSAPPEPTPTPPPSPSIQPLPSRTAVAEVSERKAKPAPTKAETENASRAAGKPDVPDPNATNLTGHLLMVPGVGASLAFGNVMANVPQSRVISAVGGAFTLDAGVGVSRTLSLGVWSVIGVHAAGDGCKAGDAGSVQCTAMYVGGGPLVRLQPSTSNAFRPWAAAGFGYRWQRYLTRTQIRGGQSVKGFYMYNGLELLHLSAGANYFVTKAVGLGPFISFDLGTYSKYLVSYPGNSGSRDIDNTATHYFLVLGAQALFDVSLRGGQ